MKNVTTRFLVRSALIAAVYVALCLALPQLSYGEVQFRLAESLTVLPLLMPETIPGLYIGCLISNIFSPTSSILDIIFGSLTTLIAALITWKSRKIYFGIIPPIVLNALIVPIINMVSITTGAYWIFALFVFIGQATVICVLGIPLYFSMKKLGNSLY